MEKAAQVVSFSSLNRKRDCAGFKRINHKYLRMDLIDQLKDMVKKNFIENERKGSCVVLYPMASTIDAFIDGIDLLFDAQSSSEDGKPFVIVVFLLSVLERVRSLGYLRSFRKCMQLVKSSNPRRRYLIFPDAFCPFHLLFESKYENDMIENQNNVDAVAEESMILNSVYSMCRYTKETAESEEKLVPGSYLISENSNFLQLCKNVSDSNSYFKPVSFSQFLQGNNPANPQSLIKQNQIFQILIDMTRNAEIQSEYGKENTSKVGRSDDGATDWSQHWSAEKIENELPKRKDLVKGSLEVTSYAANYESFVRSCFLYKGKMVDVFIPGTYSNRACHLDKVIVQVLPEDEWKSPVGKKLIVKQGNGDDNQTRNNNDMAISSDSKKSDTVPTGRVVYIEKRSWRPYVCTISGDDYNTLIQRFKQNPNVDSKDEDYPMNVIPMDERIPRIRIHTRKPFSFINQRFLVQIDEWPENSRHPLGHCTQVLGNVSNLNVESSCILHEVGLARHELPFTDGAMACLPKTRTYQGSDKSVQQKMEWMVPDEEVPKRRDIRETHLVMSVDPVGCVDIDDALSIKFFDEEENKNASSTHFKKNLNSKRMIEVGVHIADVSYFVTEGSQLDMEAKDRSTSIYLQERRLDMLPAQLCEDVCSLRPNVDRFALSVIWKIEVDDENQSFEVIDTWFGRTIIKSKYAMAYIQAQRILDLQDPGVALSNSVPHAHTGKEIAKDNIPEIFKALSGLIQISRIRRKQRMNNGALDLSDGSAQFKFSLDAAKQPIDVHNHEHLEVNEMIEELMVMANEAAACRVLKYFPNRALLRHHPQANKEKFEEIKQLISMSESKPGYEDLIKQPDFFDASSNKSLAESLKRAKMVLSPSAFVLIQTLAVRAMSEAQYIVAGDAKRLYGSNQKPFYHFGLGLEHYTHFTSPIRRYADVIVHRQLLASIESPDSENLELKYVDKGIQTPNQIASNGFIPGSSVMSLVDTASQSKNNQTQSTTKPLSSAQTSKPATSTHDYDSILDDILGMSVASAPSKPTPKKADDDLFNIDDLLGTTDTKLNVSTKKSNTIAMTGDGDGDDALNDLLGSFSSSKPRKETQAAGNSNILLAPGTLTTESKARIVDDSFKEEQELSTHLNVRHRTAKEASMRSQELFFALYFGLKSMNNTVRGEVTSGVVSSLRENGLICFIPKYHLRLPLRLFDKDTKTIQSIFISQKIESVDDEGNKTVNKVILQHEAKVNDSVVLGSDGLHGKLILSLELAENNQEELLIQQLDEISVLVSCEFGYQDDNDEDPFSKPAPSARIPHLKLALVIHEEDNKFSLRTVTDDNIHQEEAVTVDAAKKNIKNQLLNISREKKAEERGNSEDYEEEMNDFAQIYKIIESVPTEEEREEKKSSSGGESIGAMKHSKKSKVIEEEIIWTRRIIGGFQSPVSEKYQAMKSEKEMKVRARMVEAAFQNTTSINNLTERDIMELKSGSLQRQMRLGAEKRDSRIKRKMKNG